MSCLAIVQDDDGSIDGRLFCSSSEKLSGEIEKTGNNLKVLKESRNEFMTTGGNCMHCITEALMCMFLCSKEAIFPRLIFGRWLLIQQV